MKKQVFVLMALAFLFFLVFSLVSVSAVTVKSVSIYPTEIKPGETATIDIAIENTLNEDVEKVSVSLDFTEVPFAPFDSSNEETISEIKEDKSKSVDFRIQALSDAKSGTYKIPVKISYLDSSEVEHDKESLISITINSLPIFGVEIEDSLFLKGQSNEVVVKIVNKGLSDVRFLEAEIGSSTYYNLLSQKRIYIGDVDSDDFETAEFKLFFRENAPSVINLPITLTYKDITNKNYDEDFTVSMRVYDREQALQLGLIQKSNTIYIVAGIISVVILWFVYRRIKKRRQRKKAEAAK